MPTPRMTMKAIQEVIRLHAAGLSQRQIAQACRLSKGAIGKYLQKAEQASISWPLPPEMDPAKLEALLFPSHRSATVTAPVMPDFAAIHTEMRRKGMTLQLLWEEYVAAHDEQRVYQYSQFCAAARVRGDGYEGGVTGQRPFGAQFLNLTKRLTWISETNITP